MHAHTSVAILAQTNQFSIMYRAAKLRKLDEFRRSVPDVSASALEAVLKKAQRDMPELMTRGSMREARDSQVNEVTAYGAMMTDLEVDMVDGTKDIVKVISPFAQLTTAANRCEGFATMLSDKLAECPCTYDDPWSFVLYSDEVVPGNQLSFHNLRKCWVLYWSFLQFGPALLCNEDAWFCIACERSDRVKGIAGGMAQLFKVILMFVFAAGGHSLLTAGVALNLFGRPTCRVWAKLRMILQDGGAHKVVFCLKGDAGLKHCLKCRTLYTAASGLVDEAGDQCLTCNMHLFDDMDFATDAEVRNTVRRLANVARTTPGELKLREIACGFNHNVHNLLLEPALDNIVMPVSNLAHDWMHTCVVHGVFNTVLFLLLTCLVAATGSSAVIKNIHEYIGEWKLPKRVGGMIAQLVDAFSPNRWKSSSKARYFKCTASDAMTMYGIIGCFICAVYLRAGICVEECKAYMRLCDVLDLLAACPHGTVSPDQLHEAVDAFLRACLRAQWREFMHPKFHWLLHLAIELFEFGTLLTCWVHERKHRMVKRYTNSVRNTRTFESSILSEITCQHLYNIGIKDAFDLSIGLKEPFTCCAAATIDFLSRALNVTRNSFGNTSKSARVSKFEVVHVGDVVVFKDNGHLSVGQVRMFVDVDDIPMAVISWWRFKSKDMQSGCAEVHCGTDLLRFRPCEDICAACLYRIKPNDIAQVILSCLHREGVC